MRSAAVDSLGRFGAAVPSLTENVIVSFSVLTSLQRYTYCTFHFRFYYNVVFKIMMTKLFLQYFMIAQ